ncbi:MAG TPA: hypothetical protein PLK94_05165 [Alphaproteobacteria bacterium]|nr:hypothetical protein [Alphaproteobacteria bacterium]
MVFTAFSPPPSGSGQSTYSHGASTFGAPIPALNRASYKGTPTVKFKEISASKETAAKQEAPPQYPIYKDALKLVIELNSGEIQNIKAIFFGEQSTQSSSIHILDDKDRQKLRFKVNANGHDIDATIGKKTIRKICALTSLEGQTLRKAPYAAQILSHQDALHWRMRIRIETEAKQLPIKQPAPPITEEKSSTVESPASPQPSQTTVTFNTKSEDREKPSKKSAPLRQRKYEDIDFRKIVYERDEKELLRFLQEARSRHIAFIEKRIFDTRKKELAEEILQEVHLEIVEIFRSGKQLSKHHTSFGGWVRIIMERKTARLLKYRFKNDFDGVPESEEDDRTTTLVYDDITDTPCIDLIPPEQRAEKLEKEESTKRLITYIIKKASRPNADKSSIMLKLKYVNGLRTDEIAEIYNVTTVAVRVAINKEIRCLKEGQAQRDQRGIPPIWWTTVSKEEVELTPWPTPASIKADSHLMPEPS